MNALRDALINQKITFYVKCFGAFLWLAGFTLLFSVSWKACAGVFLVACAAGFERT